MVWGRTVTEAVEEHDCSPFVGVRAKLLRSFVVGELLMSMVVIFHLVASVEHYLGTLPSVNI